MCGFQLTRSSECSESLYFSGASVVIDGKKHDTTDNAGYYTLQHMHSGVFEVTVLKEDVQFPQAKVRKRVI